MKPRFGLLILCMLFSVAAWSAPETPEPPVPKEAALHAIVVFREQPQTETGRGAAALIVRFAEESPAVKVSIDKTQTEWFGPKEDLKNYSILLVAYIAGSVRSQLESGRTEHDVSASTQQLLETYQKLKQNDPHLRIEPVEKKLAEIGLKSKEK